MKANELMIGDWVYNPFTSKTFRLTFGRDLDLVEGLCLESIPLTGEILKKNGFESRHRRYIWKKRDNYCSIKVSFAPKLELESEIFDEPPIMLQVNGATFSLNIIVDYVHELQHALKLCGIEKEIII